MRTRWYSIGAITLLVAVIGGYVRLTRLAAQSLPAQDQESRSAQVSAALERKRVRKFVSGEVIVRRTGGLGALAESTRAPLRLGTLVRTTSDGRQVYSINRDVLTGMSADAGQQETLKVAQNLQNAAGVAFAQPNYIYHPVDTMPNDTRFNEQWHLRPNGEGNGMSPGGISLPRVWDKNTGGDVVVAVIDTGILKHHPDIEGSPNLLPGFDMIRSDIRAHDSQTGRDADATDTGDAVDASECGPGDPEVAEPSSWHGTHVAGIIGVGNTNNSVGLAGINWNVKVLPVRVLGKCGGTSEDIADGIRWAAGLNVPNTQPNTNQAKVINLSLGGFGSCNDDQVIRDAIKAAVAKGVTVVVAAGNEAMDASMATPASCPDVITVAASDFTGSLVTRYSNFGPAVEIMAPGGDVRRKDNGTPGSGGILSLVDASAGTYAYYNGTSMAAPQVAGVAALMLACDKSLTPAQILARLQATALPRTSTQCPKACGAGLLNALAALPPTCGGSGPAPTLQQAAKPLN
jgi:serine protease